MTEKEAKETKIICSQLPLIAQKMKDLGFINACAKMSDVMHAFAEEFPSVLTKGHPVP